MFLSAFDLPKVVYIATAGGIGLFVDITRLSVYFFNDDVRLPSYIVYSFLLFIPASFLGAQIAKYIVGYIPQKKFSHFVMLFLLLVGGVLILSL